jgi:hypothetical protein
MKQDHQIATIDNQKVCQLAGFDKPSNCYARKSGPKSLHSSSAVNLQEAPSNEAILGAVFILPWMAGRFGHDYYSIWFNFTANFFISEEKVCAHLKCLRLL